MQGEPNEGVDRLETKMSGVIYGTALYNVILRLLTGCPLILWTLCFLQFLGLLHEEAPCMSTLKDMTKSLAYESHGKKMSPVS